MFLLYSILAFGTGRVGIRSLANTAASSTDGRYGSEATPRPFRFDWPQIGVHRAPCWMSNWPGKLWLGRRVPLCCQEGTAYRHARAMPSVDVFLYGVASVPSLARSHADGVGEKRNPRQRYRLLYQDCGLQESQCMPQHELAKAPDLEP